MYGPLKITEHHTEEAKARYGLERHIRRRRRRRIVFSISEERIVHRMETRDEKAVC
jgi:hypothetical protein